MVDPQINSGQGDTLTRSQQRVGRLPVMLSSKLHSMAPFGEGGVPAVSAMEQTAGVLVHNPPEPPALSGSV